MMIFDIMIGGINLWVDPPRRLKLTVDHDYETRREREQETRFGNIPPLNLPESMIRRSPPVKRIHLDYHYQYDGVEHKTPCVIEINLEKRRIDYGYSSNWLFGKEYKGSGVIGVAIFSLPVVLVLSPFLWAWNKYYRLSEKSREMSRHSIAVLRAIGDQLDSETKTLLAEAMKNTWKHEKEMSRIVSLEEARRLLYSCELVEEFVSADQEIFDTEARGFHWFNDNKDQIANGSFYGTRDHFVNILGSTFENVEADALTVCYRTRKLWQDGNLVEN